jgi:hypothetical protein
MKREQLIDGHTGLLLRLSTGPTHFHFTWPGGFAQPEE